jgi:hypothetical protein
MSEMRSREEIEKRLAVMEKALPRYKKLNLYGLRQACESEIAALRWVLAPAPRQKRRSDDERTNV